MGYEDDAREFGEFVRHGGSWAYGLKVARWVEPGTGGPRTGTDGPVKVSARRFADDAQVSRKSVDRYLNAWDYAADAGLVPHSKNIEPGEDVALDGLDAEQWTEAYRKGNKPKHQSDDEQPAEDAALELARLKLQLVKQVRAMTKVGQFTPETVVEIFGDEDDEYKTIEYAVAGMASWLNQINEQRAQRGKKWAA